MTGRRRSFAHLELTREIIRRFNGMYKKGLFPEPEPILTKTPKLLGLDNRKMSKSYVNFIALSDTPEEIEKKVTMMITDPERIKLKDKGHPAICNVFSYFSTFAKPEVTANAKDWCEGATVGCTVCKKALAKILADHLDPIRTRRDKISDADAEIIIRDGAKRARAAAGETMAEVKKLVNLVP